MVTLCVVAGRKDVSLCRIVSQFAFSPSPQPSPSRGEGADMPSPSVREGGAEPAAGEGDVELRHYPLPALAFSAHSCMDMVPPAFSVRP